ncbi:ATP-binding protein [Streptomyces sp. JW3]|uniref:ATP-binding protein n=1 Tax=Streptomyces sp. JW3 TaxID=3456955 RepID=UPI003FA44C7E
MAKQASTSTHEITCRLPRSRSSVPRARAMLHAVLSEWNIGQDVLEAAELLLSELVTNALRVPVPSGRQVGVRIAQSQLDGILRMEVSDAGPGRPEVRAPADDEAGGRGLLLVEALSHRWGVEERANGIGKTVWAELKAPDIITEPLTKEIAAAAVRPGQTVKSWGEWHTVLDVTTEQPSTPTAAVILTLDEGPPLRVRATEPLAVRQGDDGVRGMPENCP